MLSINCGGVVPVDGDVAVTGVAVVDEDTILVMMTSDADAVIIPITSLMLPGVVSLKYSTDDVNDDDEGEDDFI